LKLSKTHHRRLPFGGFVLICIFAASSLHAWDLGFLLNQKPLLEGTGGDLSFSYNGGLVSWFQTPLGDKADLYLSAGVLAEYDEEYIHKWKVFPEIYRFQATIRPAGSLSLTIGRLQFSDPTAYVAQGLFDGISGAFNAGGTGLTLGGFYTGLLYKKTANITISQADLKDYNTELSVQKPSTYFAPRRAVAAVNWNIPGLFVPRGDFTAGGLFQFDFTYADITLHSQYLSLAYVLPLANQFTLGAGGAFEVMEVSGRSTALGFAVNADFAWMLPTKVQDKLALGIKWASGEVNDTIRAFTPVSTVSMGHVLKPKLSGLMLIEADYAARLHQTLSAEFFATYFLRTDDLTFADKDLKALSSSYLLGGEIYGGLTWVPVSDISLTAGAGAFFPQLGRAFVSDAKIKWLISMGLMIAF
jgi:hypothetical protein